MHIVLSSDGYTYRTRTLLIKSHVNGNQYFVSVVLCVGWEPECLFCWDLGLVFSVYPDSFHCSQLTLVLIAYMHCNQLVFQLWCFQYYMILLSLTIFLLIVSGLFYCSLSKDGVQDLAVHLMYVYLKNLSRLHALVAVCTS